MRATRLQACLLLLVLGGLGYGMARLLALRAGRGDVYARYSTLRSDPLGARILIDALREIEGLRVRRNTAPLRHLWQDPDETIFFLGTSPSRLASAPSGDDLELVALVRQGARAVIALAPAGDRPPVEDEDPAPDEPKRQPFDRLLGFRMERAPLPEDEEHEPVAGTALRMADGGAGLPETLPWHAAFGFADLAEGWRVIYARAGKPVLIERDLGRGSLVVSADSFVLSNEALAADPRAPLVSFFVGRNRSVVFDETHLGVLERQGVASLMRRYALHGFVAVILLVAVLFVWRASVPFVPPGDEPDPGSAEAVTGREAAAGLVTILRRGIPVSDVLRVCRTLWTRTFERRRPDLVAALEGLTVEAADPVEGYRRISRTLQEMKVNHER